jgi:hypothetical protein
MIYGNRKYITTNWSNNQQPIIKQFRSFSAWTCQRCVSFQMLECRNSSNKILDMEVWMDSETRNILFRHYEKLTASHNIMHANSAQWVTCRNSVHKQEILRRLLNSSQLVDWKPEVAPVLSSYMACMKRSGYPEKYRVDTLVRALTIYDKMLEDDQQGPIPHYRGHIAPIFVPPYS